MFWNGQGRLGHLGSLIPSNSLKAGGRFAKGLGGKIPFFWQHVFLFHARSER